MVAFWSGAMTAFSSYFSARARTFSARQCCRTSASESRSHTCDRSVATEDSHLETFWKYRRAWQSLQESTWQSLRSQVRPHCRVCAIERLVRPQIWSGVLWFAWGRTHSSWTQAIAIAAAAPSCFFLWVWCLPFLPGHTFHHLLLLPFRWYRSNRLQWVRMRVAALSCYSGLNHFHS